MASHQRAIGIIGDTDTVTGFLMAGIGEMKGAEGNFFIVDHETTRETIQNAFTALTDRTDIAILLLCQFAGDKIRDIVQSYESITPVILEIPSKSDRYDATKDSIFVH